ncbi:nematocyst expressed protein 3-like [Schistocerca nitens]|uniref:nematocyst expressed protein 3-like n=1 Tax=Schistocerca nitens TaxID=7011 RepID=UPI002117B27B|nr:nematocyst expressed protein 3-like [Schistocerca nitens]
MLFRKAADGGRLSLTASLPPPPRYRSEDATEVLVGAPTLSRVKKEKRTEKTTFSSSDRRRAPGLQPAAPRHEWQLGRRGGPPELPGKEWARGRWGEGRAACCLLSADSEGTGPESEGTVGTGVRKQRSPFNPTDSLPALEPAWAAPLPEPLRLPTSAGAGVGRAPSRTPPNPYQCWSRRRPRPFQNPIDSLPALEPAWAAPLPEPHRLPTSAGAGVGRAPSRTPLTPYQRWRGPRPFQNPTDSLPALESAWAAPLPEPHRLPTSAGAGVGRAPSRTPPTPYQRWSRRGPRPFQNPTDSLPVLEQAWAAPLPEPHRLPTSAGVGVGRAPSRTPPTPYQRWSRL